VVGRPDKDSYFVGHSIGCQTIMRYLETIDSTVGGIVLVAGFFTLKGLETDEEKEIARPWLEKPVNFGKIKKAAKKFVAIFSDNDKWVPLENERTFKEKLGAKTIALNGSYGEQRQRYRTARSVK